MDAPSQTKLTDEEIRRYSRHLVLPEVGVEGQAKLKAASVLCIGAGGLGSPAAMYLAAAGIGRIGLVDFDVVDETNLQRQLLHGTRDVGRSKLQSAAETIHDINPHTAIESHETRLTSDNALGIFEHYDIVIDGTDNFPTRYLSNDACVLLKKPNIYGSIFRFEGQASVFAPHLGGPCYRCLYPEPPPPGLVPTCAEGGVLGVLPGVIGVIQATEAIKLILGCGEPLIGRLLLYNALDMRFREMRLRRDKNCPLCGEHPTLTKLIDYFQFCGVEPEVPAAPQPSPDEITATELAAMLRSGAKFALVDVREPAEWAICRIPGAKLLPLSDLPARHAELPKDQLVVLHCKGGRRSMKALQFLREQGYQNLKSVRGGIEAWATEVDPGCPKY
ncbi:MAG: molybdopterin-synthase adenylyltransferase MoeB [Verrucomicrobiae bacterium]|nr:molybdopterin-synthase adenylyltransferase MoeB [Verrucomicrobiae bacterium]